MANEKNTPMYFASLKLKNVKCFGGEQVLNLRDNSGALSPWTLILGDNGVGKTTLLKCLTWMMPVELPEDEKIIMAKQLQREGVNFSIIEKVTGISQKQLEKDENPKQNEGANNNNRAKIKPLMDNFEDESDYNSIIRVGDGVEMSISAELTNGLNLKKIPSNGDLITIGINLKRVGSEIQDIENTDHLVITELEEFNSVNLYAYGAGRHMASENFEKSELRESTYNLLSDSADLYDAEEVLSNLYNASVQEKINQNIGHSPGLDNAGKASKLFQKVKEILTQLLPYIESPDDIIVNQAVDSDGIPNNSLVEIKTPFGKVGLFDLSLGYKTMLAWVVDLAIRMLWRNPESNSPLEEPAVVIVDEIDLHLHPKWQRTIKKYLTDHFPNAQFICTAHSPFIVQASETENLCVLYQDKYSPNEVRIENDPFIVRGWRIGQIITSDLIGIESERSAEIEDLEKQRRRILDKIEPLNKDEEGNLKELNEKLEKLTPTSDNEDDRKLMEQIRKTADFLRNQGKLL